MILKTLRIQNFRKYKQTSLEFPEGIIGVIGLNGSGKSTIFEAIAWVLFGTVAARTSSEDIRRKTAEPSSVCLVELCFQFEGDEYRVVRQMKGKNLVSTATVTKNEKIVATGAGTSAGYIQTLLGMDYKSFFTSIFAKQKELNTLSSMNAHERRPLILKMLGIDALDDVIKHINTDKRTKSLLINRLEESLMDSQGKNKETMLQQHEKDLKKKYHQSSSEVRELKKILQIYKQDQQQVQITLNKARKDYEAINTHYESLIAQKTQYERIKTLIQKQKPLEKKIEKRKQTITDLTNETSEFEKINEELKLITNKIITLQKQSKLLLQKVTKQQSAKDHLISHQKEMRSKQESMTTLGADAPCPTCERELGSQYQLLLNKYQEKQHDIETKIKSMQQEIKSLRDQQEQITKETNAFEKKKQFYTKKQHKLHEIRIKIESQIQELKQEEQELNTIRERLKKTPLPEFDESQFVSIQRKQKEAYQQYQRLNKKASKAKENVSTQQLQIEKKQGYRSLLKQKIESVKTQIEDLNNLLQTISKEHHQVIEITWLKEVMGSFRLHLISRIRPALSQYASDFFHDLTDGKYPEMDLDDQYNIYVYDDGEKYPIQRFSGGEIDLANLCLRLAISDVITEKAEGLFHFIILDEIFGSQDRFRQQNIMQQLYKLSSTFKQIFLITHVEDVKHYMQHIIHVEEINNESMITIN